MKAMFEDKKRRNEKGFTLLEVMIALAVLAGVVFTVLASLNYNLDVASYNRDVISATVLGRQKAEEVALYGVPNEDRGSFTGPFSRFSWAIRTEETEIQGLKRINLKVVWDNGKNVTFTSFLRKK